MRRETVSPASDPYPCSHRIAVVQGEPGIGQEGKDWLPPLSASRQPFPKSRGETSPPLLYGCQNAYLLTGTRCLITISKSGPVFGLPLAYGLVSSGQPVKLRVE